jgi:hypothetical protein
LVVNEAQRIFGHLPGVGSAVAGDLFALGYRSANDLASEDPSLMYERLCTLQGCRVDRCMLYVFRCCVHVTRTGETHWQWWDFKDGGAAGL